jgi:nitrate reductase assembly molybdenum cofactor insertion protein NarJ
MRSTFLCVCFVLSLPRSLAPSLPLSAQLEAALEKERGTVGEREAELAELREELHQFKISKMQESMAEVRIQPQSCSNLLLGSCEI